MFSFFCSDCFRLVSANIVLEQGMCGVDCVSTGKVFQGQQPAWQGFSLLDLPCHLQDLVHFLQLQEAKCS